MEGARITRLLCEISILKYCLLNELFEKWRIPPPPSPLVMWPVVGRHMISSGSFWRVPTWDPPPLARHSGGGGLGCPLPGFSRRSRLLVQARGKIHSARVKLSGPVLSEPSRTTMYPCMSTFSARNFMQIYALYRGVIWIFCTQVVKNLILGGKQFFSPLYW
jgi:hypothetical protein